MERLTEKYNGKNIVKSGHITFIYGTAGNRFEGEAIDKLSAYEDAEEQGLLIRLPCKVGDAVYYLERFCGGAMDCPSGPCEDCSDYKIEINEGKFMLSNIYDLGKTVFLTEAEAEAKLAEIEGAE